MIARLAVFAVCVVAAIGSAVAGETPACGLTLEQVRTLGAGWHKNDGASYVEYEGEDASKIINAVNAFPPVSAYVDEIVVVIARADVTKVALVHAGCVDHALLPPPAAWDALVNEALGDKS